MSGIAGSDGGSVFDFWRTRLSSVAAEPLYTTLSRAQGSSFFMSSPTLVILHVIAQIHLS